MGKARPSPVDADARGNWATDRCLNLLGATNLIYQTAKGRETAIAAVTL
jgi:hypothetical protein